MKENKEDRTMRMSNEETRFLDLIENNPIKVLNGITRYDLIKPLIWIDRNSKINPLSWQQLSIKYNITISQVRTILKNIKNNK